jgi:hypothetical protein
MAGCIQQRLLLQQDPSASSSKAEAATKLDYIERYLEAIEIPALKR